MMVTADPRCAGLSATASALGVVQGYRRPCQRRQRQVTLRMKRKVAHPNFFSSLPFRLVANSSSSARCTLVLRTRLHRRRVRTSRTLVGEVGEQKLGARTVLGPALLRTRSHSAPRTLRSSRYVYTCHYEHTCSSSYIAHGKEGAHANFFSSLPFRLVANSSSSARCTLVLRTRLHRRRIRTSPLSAPRSHPPRSRAAAMPGRRTVGGTGEGSHPA